MGLHYENLDQKTRVFMVEEVDAGPHYQSPRLTDAGLARWVPLLKEAAQSHEDDWLARQLPALIKHSELWTPKSGKPSWRKINIENASQMLAEGEFNRFYLRGLCLRANEAGIRHLEVYRGKNVSQPRPESEAKIGNLVEAAALLAALRSLDFVSIDQTAFAIPSGPNSGLTARLPKL